jgi:hypothetical protein
MLDPEMKPGGTDFFQFMVIFSTKTQSIHEDEEEK